MPVNLTEYFCLHRKFLLYNLILRNLKVRYRKSFFGMFWTILVPAGSALIYFAIFHFVLKVKMPNYLLYILAGLIPWTFFSTTLTVSLELLVNNFSLLNKVPLPPQALVLAEAATNMLNFLLSLPVLFAVIIITGASFDWTLLQLIPLTVCIFSMAYSFGLLLGLAFVFLRDLRYLTGLIMQFWFYLTPIMYSPDMIPENYRNLARLNPMFELLDGFHLAAVTNQWIGWDSWLRILLWVLALASVSFILLVKTRKKIVELL